MGLRNILPFEKYSLITSLSADEVHKRIAENVDPGQTGFFSFFNRQATKPYEGTVMQDRFEICRVIDYRNSFLPVIFGQIIPVGRQTQIKLRMRPVRPILIFVSFWLGIVGLICMGIILAGIMQFSQVLQRGFSLSALIPFGMFLFGYLLVYFGFKREAGISKEFFEKIFEAKEIK